MKNLFVLVVLMLITTIAQAKWEQDVRLTNDSAVSTILMGRAKCIATQGDSVHVVWFDNRDGNFEIYYKRSTDAGVSWSKDTRLTNAADTSRNPAISIIRSVVNVVWCDKRDGNPEIYYKCSTDAGITWSEDMRLTNNPATSGVPCIATSGLNVHVIWRERRDGNYEIYYKRSEDGGITWGNDYRMTNDMAMSYNNSISVSDSIVHIVWEDLRNGSGEIYYKRSTDGGITWSEDIRLTNNSSASNLPILTAFDSDLYLLWNDSRDGNWELYYKRSTDEGITWSRDTRLTNTPGNSWWSSIAVNASGVHIVWEENSYNRGKDEIFYKYSNNSGLSWSVDTSIVDTLAKMSERPSITISDSVVHVIWSDYRDGNAEIYYKRNPMFNYHRKKDLKILESDYSVFPNPANDYLDILLKSIAFFESSERFEIHIYNLLGELIMNVESRSDLSMRIDVSTFPKGIYYLTIKTQNVYETKKLVIVR